MAHRKFLQLLIIISLALMVGVGCAKKAATPDAPEGDPNAMNEAEIAARNLAEAQRMIVSEKIYFAFDSFELTPESRAILDRKAEVLKTTPDLRVLVEGHCDERGTNEYNLALGERRARAVQKYLILLGVNPAQMEIISYGEERPEDMGHSEGAWAKNRRAEFETVW